MANSITMQNAGRAKQRLKRIVPALEQRLRDEIHAAATDVKEKSIAAIDAPKSGKLYRRRRRNKQWLTWTASAPGEAPARKTGERAAKIKVRRWNRANKPGAKIVAPGIFRLLERGLKHVQPRPLFGPLMSEFRAEYRKRVEAAVGRAVGLVVKSN